MLQKISPHLRLSGSQHGFRAARSTTTALLPLVHKVVLGFNQYLPPHRTVAMAVDFSKAFDTIDHTNLLSAFHNSTMDANTIRWLCTYLRGRTASCSYNRTNSPKIIIHQGVPQGSILSPQLFNLYVSTYPETSELCTSYADDFTAATSNSKVENAAAELARHAEDVAGWAEERGLIVSTQKSTVTLFTPERKQSHRHPIVPLNGSLLPLDRNPTILGVTFDPHVFFHQHVAKIVERAKPQLNLLRLLCGTNWGQQKETIVITFKSLIDSLFTYAAPVWFPNAKSNSIKKLQVIQNSALRIATGCVKMTALDHLHAETKTLKVDEHLRMLCTQFLATCLQPGHVSFPIVTADSGPRRMKHTLQTAYLDQIGDLLDDGCVLDIKEARKVIHTRAVEAAVRGREPNRVLGTAPPDLDEEERELSRGERTALAQLRSGFSADLNTFRSAIGASDTTLCPCCRQEEHTTQHIFQCPEHPTALTPLDMWLHPRSVAEHLQAWPCFAARIQRERPPPEPPPPSN